MYDEHTEHMFVRDLYQREGEGMEINHNAVLRISNRRF